jgi:hypothetical protein
MEEIRNLNNEIGEYLEESTRQALKVLGYSVFNHKITDAGIDVLAVSKDNKIILAIECLNWSKWSYANASRLRSLLNNFDKYPSAVKVLLSSYNVLSRQQKKVLEKHHVLTVELGEQLLSSEKREVAKILDAIYWGVVQSRAYYSFIIPEDKVRDILNVDLIINGYPDLVKQEEESVEVDANSLQIINSKDQKPDSIKDSSTILSEEARREGKVENARSRVSLPTLFLSSSPQRKVNKDE